VTIPDPVDPLQWSFQDDVTLAELCWSLPVFEPQFGDPK
jgi:hypothetical protein